MSTLQLSMDRIQKAATRSPIILPCEITGEQAAISVMYELCPGGVCIHFHTVNNISGAKLDIYKKVLWSEIACCVKDPLDYRFDIGLEEIKKARLAHPKKLVNS